MKSHPRHVPVEQARRDLDSFVQSLNLRYDLTHCEELSLLAELLFEKLAADVKWERRDGKEVRHD